MRWLNYHHLLYFWTVARTGSIAAASRELFVSQPAISTQIKLLEEELETPLFRRAGRGLEMTDAGRKAYEYADQIFRLGSELRDAVGRVGSVPRLRIGLSQMTPKLLAGRLLRPVLAARERGLRVELRTGPSNTLFEMLAARGLDCVLSDDEQPPSDASAPHAELVQRVDYALFGLEPREEQSCALATKAETRTVVLPAVESPLRRRFDAWAEAERMTLEIAAESDDGGVLLELASHGAGELLAPQVLAPALQAEQRLHLLGELPGVYANLFLHSTPASRAHPIIEWMMQERGTPALPQTVAFG